MFDVLIIGGGPAGLSAAIYSCRRKAKTLLISKDIGGRTGLAVDVSNYPGFKRGRGVELIGLMKSQAESFGCEFVFSDVVNIKRKGDNFEVLTAAHKRFSGKRIIVATGGVENKLGISGEERLVGRGVSYCATCDSPLFRNKVTAIIGGGNSAVCSAQIVAKYVKKLYLIHRRDEFSADPVEVDKLKRMKNVEIIVNDSIVEIIGEDRVKSIRLKSGKVLEVAGVFIEVGIVPAGYLVKDLGINVDGKGFIVVDDLQETNVKGIFAACDVTTKNGGLRQIIVASGEGAVAGYFASKNL